MLTAWEGLDAAQAAAVLGCTPEAVHTRVHRARARLHNQLDRETNQLDRETSEVPIP